MKTCLILFLALKLYHEANPAILRNRPLRETGVFWFCLHESASAYLESPPSLAPWISAPRILRPWGSGWPALTGRYSRPLSSCLPLWSLGSDPVAYSPLPSYLSPNCISQMRVWPGLLVLYPLTPLRAFMEAPFISILLFLCPPFSHYYIPVLVCFIYIYPIVVVHLRVNLLLSF